MIAKGKEGIAHIARYVRSLRPDVSPFGEARLLAMCLDLVGEDFDRVVDILVNDYLEMRSIFERGLPLVDPSLRARILERLTNEAESFRVSELTVRADLDMRVLIDLHRFVESGEQRSAEAADLDGHIWRFLESYAARRAYQTID